MAFAFTFHFYALLPKMNGLLLQMAKEQCALQDLAARIWPFRLSWITTNYIGFLSHLLHIGKKNSHLENEKEQLIKLVTIRHSLCLNIVAL